MTKLPFKIDLGGKTAVVTGAGGVLCGGFAKTLAACGAKVALLDLNEPWRVLYRTKDYIMTPDRDYERTGDVPNVVFPCAALTDAETGRIAIYYGCADTVTGIAFTTVDELIRFVKEHS